MPSQAQHGRPDGRKTCPPPTSSFCVFAWIPHKKEVFPIWVVDGAFPLQVNSFIEEEVALVSSLELYGAEHTEKVLVFWAVVWMGVD